MIKDLALAQIRMAREYSLHLLDSIPEPDWLRMPPSCPTHVLWQAAHLAVAQYRLALGRVRGPMPEDDKIMPATLIERYGKDSVPSPDPKLNRSPSEVRALLAEVHAMVIDHADRLTDADLRAPMQGPPHPQMKTKEDALWWCGRHELVHAGQIALLRRLLGHAHQW